LLLEDKTKTNIQKAAQFYIQASGTTKNI